MGSAKQVSGPEGPIQPTGVREKRLPSDAEAFQKALDKVGEADPEQKKKQRQKEEEEIMPRNRMGIPEKRIGFAVRSK